MARTVQALLDSARVILNDEAGTRYKDDQLCGYVVDALFEARSIRPDLFVGQYALALPDTIVPGDAFPLPDQFFAATREFVISMAELRDDEWVNEGRVSVLRATLKQKLTTGM